MPCILVFQLENIKNRFFVLYFNIPVHFCDYSYMCNTLKIQIFLSHFIEASQNCIGFIERIHGFYQSP